MLGELSAQGGQLSALPRISWWKSLICIRSSLVHSPSGLPFGAIISKMVFISRSPSLVVTMLVLRSLSDIRSAHFDVIFHLPLAKCVCLIKLPLPLRHC